MDGSGDLQSFTGLAALARDITVTGVLLIGFWLWLTDRIVTRKTHEARLADAEKRVLEAQRREDTALEGEKEWRDIALDALHGLKHGVSTTAEAVRLASGRGNRRSRSTDTG